MLNVIRDSVQSDRAEIPPEVLLLMIAALVIAAVLATIIFAVVCGIDVIDESCQMLNW